MVVRALVVEEGRAGSDLGRILEADRDIDAGTPCTFARLSSEARLRHPDVVVMLADHQSQALAAIEQLMASQPVPILVVGDISRTLVVGAGAIEVVANPTGEPAGETAFRHLVRAISRVNVIRHIRGRARSGRVVSTVPVVGIAASTGGPQAVVALLQGLAGLPAAVLVVQHLHRDFIATFRDWIARECPLPIDVATSGMALEPGHVYLGPPDVHLKLAAGRQAVLDPEPMTLHRPSADVLFRSMAEHGGHGAVGVLLTGMGDDGAAGLLEMRLAGAWTVAQDERSSAVYGMPQAADRLGAAIAVLPLEQIANEIVRAIRVAV